MPELPKLDPSWTRRRQPPPPEDRSLRFVAVASVAVILIGLWAARAHTDRQAQAAARHAEAVAAIAHQRFVDGVRAARDEEARTARRLSYNNARQATAAGSSIGGDKISQCEYAGNTSYQRGPCKLPWIEVSAESSRSAGYERARDEQWVQEQAEARLRAEHDRFAALTGQGSQSWPSSPSSASQANRARCEQARALRDEAYRAMGNNRTFDFIRRWNDIVYEACKNS